MAVQLCRIARQTFTRGDVQISRLFRTSAYFSSGNLSQEFQQAKERLNKLTEDPGNAKKLELYALFKQATVGKCSGKRPGMTDFVGRAKWDAWNALGDISQEEAQKKYIGVIDGLVASSAPAEPSSSSTDGATGDVLSSLRGKAHVVTLNRPTKKNAIKVEMYADIVAALKKAGEDKSSVAVLTGAGDYFCSGNDLSNFLSITPETVGEVARKSKVILQDYVAAYIDFPKPLIALVNGPAVGISVTVLGLFDAVIASDRATFHTPFSSLGQSPEGCSSFTFPRIMGHAHACDLLLFNKKITAAEAKQRGLVTEVIPDANFQTEAWKIVEEISKLPPQALKINKQVVREGERKQLHEVNKRECEVLCERWQSEECAAAIMSFFSRKS